MTLSSFGFCRRMDRVANGNRHMLSAQLTDRIAGLADTANRTRTMFGY